MTGKVQPTYHLNTYQLQTALRQGGMSPQGAYQLATDQPVTNPADRQAVSRMLGQLMLRMVVQGGVIEDRSAVAARA